MSCETELETGSRLFAALIWLERSLRAWGSFWVRCGAAVDLSLSLLDPLVLQFLFGSYLGFEDVFFVFFVGHKFVLFISLDVRIERISQLNVFVFRVKLVLDSIIFSRTLLLNLYCASFPFLLEGFYINRLLFRELLLTFLTLLFGY